MIETAPMVNLNAPNQTHTVVDGDTLTLYYGASDSVICGARFSIQEILQTLRSPS